MIQGSLGPRSRGDHIKKILGEDLKLKEILILGKEEVVGDFDLLYES